MEVGTGWVGTPSTMVGMLLKQQDGNGAVGDKRGESQRELHAASYIHVKGLLENEEEKGEDIQARKERKGRLMMEADGI